MNAARIPRAYSRLNFQLATPRNWKNRTPLAKGAYRMEIVVKDMATGKLAADSIEFAVK